MAFGPSRQPLGYVFFALFLLILSVRTPLVECARDLNNGADHRAHSVPAGPYRAYDESGSGYAVVRLDGSRSHSHYFNPVTNVYGRVVSYIWSSPPGGPVICRAVRCSVRLPLGVAIVRLLIIDNTGDRATAITRVTVVDGGKPGVRLLFYPGDHRVPAPRYAGMASLSRTPPRLTLYGKKEFPTDFLSRPCTMRALGQLDITEPGLISFRLDCGDAYCSLQLDGAVILPFAKGIRSSFPRKFSDRPYLLHIVWRWYFPSATQPRLSLFWKRQKDKIYNVVQPPFLAHRPALYRPVIHYITPTSNIRVDTTLVIRGSSFVNIVAVYIGTSRCVNPVAKHQFLLTCDVASTPGIKPVVVVTRAGRSNPVTIQVVSLGRSDGGFPAGYSQPVNFARSVVTLANGQPFKFSGPTSIALGPDGKYYIGVQWGAVFVVSTNGRVATGVCASPSVGDGRSVLGVAFNPAEPGRIKLYASSSIIEWHDRHGLPLSSGWRNGEIIIMEPRGNCIAKTGTLITGLPVSNYDHAVNKLAFDNSGRLYISVGSATNAGVPFPEMGNIADSPLSGAVLVADIRKKAFNGNIRYANADSPATARVIGGDVSIYSAGLRNCFGLEFHSNGQLYATDNGANQAFGPKSTSCTAGSGRLEEPDKLLKLRFGGFYGAANRNRGRSDPRQCIHRTISKDRSGYDLPLATTESGTMGIIEYTANTFGGGLKHNLFLSQLATPDSAGRVYRVQLSKFNGSLQKIYSIVPFSGLAVAQMPDGGLLMPRVYRSQLVALLPIEKNPGVVVVTTVYPFRGPKRGGYRATITGWNLRPPLKVSFGGKQCTSVSGWRADGRVVQCTVPSGSGKVSVTVTSGLRASKSVGYEFMYMAI